MSTQSKVKKRRPRKKKSSGLSKRTADPFLLYEKSVQDPEATVDIVDAVYQSKRDEIPLILREDFCGTAKLCAEWVLSHPKRRAMGLDIDSPTLNWAQKNNVVPTGDAASRIELLERDVLKGTKRKSDAIVAFNFSYWIFHERSLLRKYFESVRRSLKTGGVFILDIHGGPDAQYALEEETEFEDFTYVWDQDSFDPITNKTMCYIHFRFPDGSEMKRAFSYDWRVWSIPELRDILEEAGFSKVDTWWDDTDDVLRPKENAVNLVSWIAYLAAWK